MTKKHYASSLVGKTVKAVSSLYSPVDGEIIEVPRVDGNRIVVRRVPHVTTRRSEK